MNRIQIMEYLQSELNVDAFSLITYLLAAFLSQIYFMLHPKLYTIKTVSWLK